MHLIALLIGLVVERLATQLFHLRRLRGLDRFIDAGFRQAARVPNWPALIPVIVIVVLLALPVFAVVFILGDALLGFPYLLLAIVVLFFSLGPQDIGEDVDEYCRAIEEGDEERIQQTAKAIIESPLGAWAYRVTDLIRRRAVFAASRDQEQSSSSEDLRDAAIELHGWLAWIPARLTAIGYAAAGNFDTAVGAWRAPTEQSSDSLSESNEHLLARVGASSLALGGEDDEDLAERGTRGATAANRLVFRLLLIWAVVIAAMTLYGWTQ
jgi:AmpE protein